MTNTTGFEAPGSWSWPDDLPKSEPRQRPSPAREETEERQAPPESPKNTSTNQQKERHYKPRTCRICLESVQPTYEPPSESLPSYLAGSPNVTYTSEDGGRLIRPCKCKGSQRYVHEGCLQEWRHADPAYGARNFWQCPTCGFKYRLERMRWGKWISSTLAQITLTLIIFLGAVFMLGFVADPIINTYTDPVGTITTMPFGEEERYSRQYYDQRRREWVDEEPAGWPEHFFKGFASLGVLGFVKMMWTLGPFNWFRIGGNNWGGGGRAGNTGRDRAANLSWIVLVVGICTFLFTVWKAVRALTRRWLEKAGERVMDVPLAGDEADDDDDD